MNNKTKPEHCDEAPRTTLTLCVILFKAIPVISLTSQREGRMNVGGGATPCSAGPVPDRGFVLSFPLRLQYVLYYKDQDHQHIEKTNYEIQNAQ